MPNKCCDCNQEFTNLNSKRCKLCLSKFLSLKIFKTCVVCFKQFEVQAYRKNSAKVCSYQCSGKLKQKRKEKICNFCGKFFFVVNSQFLYYKNAGKYCSQECVYNAIANNAKNNPIKDKYKKSNRRAD